MKNCTMFEIVNHTNRPIMSLADATRACHEGDAEFREDPEHPDKLTFVWHDGEVRYTLTFDDAAEKLHWLSSTFG